MPRCAPLLACLLLAACAAPPHGRSAASAPGPVCLASYNIDHTGIPDDSTILFTMRDHSTYRNRLAQRCVGLRLDPRGYTYEPTSPGTDEICDNLVTIRLNSYGSVCLLGAFEKLPPAPTA